VKELKVFIGSVFSSSCSLFMQEIFATLFCTCRSEEQD